MLTDSYQKTEEDFVTLSGKVIGADGVAAETIALLGGGDLAVEFKPFDKTAEQIIADKLEQEYVQNEEGFLIAVDKNAVTVYADSDRAKLYAACSVQDKYADGHIACGVYWSYPSVPHRSMRIFLPPKDEMEYFHALIDQMVHLGYNGLLLEISGAMEFKSHPEVNQAWLDYAGAVYACPEKRPLIGRTYYRTKNSVHTCNAGGGLYTQEEMKEIIRYCRDRFIEIIPEVPSLSHSEYLLVSHPELRECADEPLAATACPSNPGLNKLVFDLYDEVIAVFEPKILHIGHDEWWNCCICDACKDKDPNELYVNNIMESYNYLKERGVKTAMWADKLVPYIDKHGERHGANGKDIYHLPAQKEPKSIEMMGEEYPLYDRYWFEAPEWVKKEGFCHTVPDMNCAHMLPPDILYVNWGYATEPEIRENLLYKQGKEMILGNTLPAQLSNYDMRFRYGAQGFSVSSWSETSEVNMQSYGTVYQMGYGSLIAWKHDRTELMYQKNLFEVFHELYTLRNRETLSGHHLEVTHAMVKEWKEGRKYYDDMEVVDEEFLTVGHYCVTYTDGQKETFPATFAVNISNKDVTLERAESDRIWEYIIDPDYQRVASRCDLKKAEDGIWYTTVMPLSGEVASWEYVPKAGFENYVAVKEVFVK